MRRSDGDNDGGVSQRVMGTLLTWMSERKAPVFLVATANQINQLPPELQRVEGARQDLSQKMDEQTTEVDSSINQKIKPETWTNPDAKDFL